MAVLNQVLEVSMSPARTKLVASVGNAAEGVDKDERNLCHIGSVEENWSGWSRTTLQEHTPAQVERVDWRKDHPDKGLALPDLERQCCVESCSAQRTSCNMDAENELAGL